MKRRFYAYLMMNVYWFGMACMWNALHPIVLPALLLRFVPEGLKNTYLGALTFVGLMLAMSIQPISGAWSDHTRTRWGRRRPWMVAAAFGNLLALALMGVALHLWLLALGYLLLQITANLSYGPAQGLIPDLVPPERRGLASGFKNLFDMAGLVVASLVAGQLMDKNDPGLAFALMAGAMALSTAVTVVTTRESPSVGSPAGPRRPLTPRADLARYPAYAGMLFSRFLILSGIYILQSFAQYYIRDWLSLPNAASVTGNLMATIGVALTLLVFPAGWLSDRIGRWSLNIGAGILASIGIGLLVFAHSVTALYAFGAIVGMSTGVFVSVNWALATDLIPADEGGRYLGYTNLATAGAGAISRLSGPLIDGVNALRPGTYAGYPVAFGLAAVATLAGALVLIRVRRWAQANGQLSAVGREREPVGVE